MIKQPEYRNSLFIFNDNEEDFLDYLLFRKKSDHMSGTASIRHETNAFGIPTGTFLPYQGYSSLQHKHTKFTANFVITVAFHELNNLLHAKIYDKVIYSWDKQLETLALDAFKTDSNEVPNFIYKGIDRTVQEYNDELKQQIAREIVSIPCAEMNDMLSMVLPGQYGESSDESFLILNPNYVVLEITDNTTQEKKYVCCNPKLITQMQHIEPEVPPVPEQINSIMVARTLLQRYNHGYSPPRWSHGELISSGNDSWYKRSQKVTLFCHSYSDLTEVEQVARQREPVNIAMDKYYSTPHFDSGYTELYKNKQKLGPNFALYMLAKIKKGENYVLAHVINSIGFAFDSPNQPDQQYFLTNFETKKIEFEKALLDMFRLIFACAKTKNLAKICFCYIGGSAFSNCFPNGNNRKFPAGSLEYMPYFMKAFSEALAEAVLRHHITHISMMGNGIEKTQTIMEQLSAQMNTELNKYNAIEYKFEGKIPDILTEETQDTLFVNAWDPHSVVGNGNEGDLSIDGFFGRSSDMGFMSHPDINPYVLHNIVRI
jgi:hypothetical protein